MRLFCGTVSLHVLIPERMYGNTVRGWFSILIVNRDRFDLRGTPVYVVTSVSPLTSQSQHGGVLYGDTVKLIKLIFVNFLSSMFK